MNTQHTSPRSTQTQFVTSADGTRLAYTVSGSGPALVYVDGAICHREFGPSKDIGDSFGGDFTVYRYDRRGRGESDGAAPCDVEAQVADLAAVIAAAGGPNASVIGLSSGAVLALEAARRGVEMRALVTFEAPLIVDDTRPPNDPDLPAKVQAMVDRGDRGAAVRAFLRLVGMPAPMVWAMRFFPGWRQMLAVAHTLPHDLSLTIPLMQGEALPTGYFADVAVPTLALAGDKSPAYMRNAQRAVAAAVPGAEHDELPRQTHMVKTAVLAPVATRFLQQ